MDLHPDTEAIWDVDDLFECKQGLTVTILKIIDTDQGLIFCIKFGGIIRNYIAVNELTKEQRTWIDKNTPVPLIGVWDEVNDKYLGVRGRI